MKFNKDILPKWYSIVLWTLIILFTQGCYTQLAMFYPEPEIEQESEFSDFYQPYSMAPVRPNQEQFQNLVYLYMHKMVQDNH